MGERAKCVMLNKGPHILGAIRPLNDFARAAPCASIDGLPRETGGLTYSGARS